jgi:hypothetical protein
MNVLEAWNNTNFVATGTFNTTVGTNDTELIIVSLIPAYNGSFAGNGDGLTNLSANAIAGGLTTNLAVLVPGGGTNMLCFTNGILRAVQ